MEEFIKNALNFLPQLALAVVVLVLGWWLIARVAKMVAVAMSKQDLDISLRSFLTSLVRVTLQVVLVLSVASMIGIQTTSFVAILGAASLAVGLALQGSLANFAGGVLILIFRPFKVGDMIVAQGKAGEVKEIQIFCTILKTPEGKTIIIPNGPLSNGIIVNESQEQTLLLEFKFELDANTDIQQVRNALMPVLQAESGVLPSPAPSVGVAHTKVSSLEVIVKCFTAPAQNADVGASLNEQLRNALRKNGFIAPEVHTFVHNVA
ncbi:MAG: mechanosensitive ion channel family protein [Microscillaceae bacterium]|nr:mechanosensitive ion channel family protein [Microscillaceae bacterium]